MAKTVGIQELGRELVRLGERIIPEMGRRVLGRSLEVFFLEGIEHSPVKTGKFAASHRASLNTMAYARLPDGESFAALGIRDVRPVAERIRLDDAAYVTNDATRDGSDQSYAPILDRGRHINSLGREAGSHQAPEGVYPPSLRRTLERGAAIIRGALKKVLAENGYALAALVVGLTCGAATLEAQSGIGGIAANAFPRRVTAAQLPAANGTNGLRIVTDAASNASCTVGGGAVKLLCLDKGTWSPITDSVAADDQVAAEVAVTDAGGYFAGAQVEAVLQEIGGDARWSNARTPLAHAASHAQAGADPLAGILAVSVTGNAGTASALASDPAGCNPGSLVSDLAANGSVSCAADDDVPESGDFGALALTGDVTSSGLATTIAADSVALGSDTTGPYVASATVAQGLELAGSEGGTLGLIPCANAQILKSTGTTWACAADTGGITDHGDLTGLGDDDHPGYALLAGRSGGQTLVGGTGSTDDLVLDGSAGAAGTLTVTEGGKVLLPDGSIAAPALSFANNTSSGIVRAANHHWYLVADGADTWVALELVGSTVPGRVGIYNSDNSSHVIIGNGGGQPEILFNVSGVSGYTFGSDNDTRLQRTGADQLGLVAGGVEGVRVTTTGATVNDLLTLTARGAAPTCAAAGTPYIYYDSSGAYCACDTVAGAWVKLGGGGACA